MADYITKCYQCGSREFCVTETIDWDGEVDDQGVLTSKSSGNTIDCIHCARCGVPYSAAHFRNLEFD